MKNLWRGFLILLVAAAVSVSARAALDDRYSETEKVALAFAKLGHFKVDYPAMIKASPAYLNANPIDRVELLRRDSRRLEAGAAQYDPEQDLIDVMADVKLVPGADVEMRQMQVVFPGQAVSFPFAIGALWVDVVPVDFRAVTTLNLAENDYATFLQALGPGGSGGVPAVIEMHLRPVRVDADHPGTEMGQPAWPLLAAVKQITIWDKSRKHIVWSYAAPDYHAADTHRLNNLYIK